MNSLGTVILLANFLIMPVIMAMVKGIRGVILSVAVGWIVLSPRAGINLPGVPVLTKDFAVPYAAAIGILITRGHLLRRLRFSWIDAFFVCALISPFASSLSNGLGLWDASSELYGRLMTWGILYMVGRVLVSNLNDVRECALAILLAGIVIIPLCLFEIRMSPQLHRWVYGFYQQPFHMAKRLGGYRPMLMFRHGIEVGTWLACSGIIAVWFCLVGSRARVLFAPVAFHAVLLILVSLISRSLGSLALLFSSSLGSVSARIFNLRLILLGIALAVPGYMVLRASGSWSPDFIVEIVERYGEPRRAASFAARVYQEEELGSKARQRLLFGWGGHNRFRVFDDFGQQTTAVDALWIIIFGKNGLFGLVSLYGMLCIPSILIVLRTPTRYLFHANMAGVVALILAIFIANADSLQNAFYSPLMMIAAGVLATTAISIRRWLPPTTQAPSPTRPPPLPANRTLSAIGPSDHATPPQPQPQPSED